VTDNEGRRLLLLNGRQIRRAGTIPDAGRKKKKERKKKRSRVSYLEIINYEGRS